MGRTDLLARGKTTGETARLLVDPYRRKMELRAEAEELEKNEKQRSKTNLTGKGLFSLYISFFSSFRWAGLELRVCRIVIYFCGVGFALSREGQKVAEERCESSSEEGRQRTSS